ncbi:GntR family transcriptional regulator [Cytobacillus luteolus]|nr:GntR family transcriptional regulator [Cytobacillus luteolus]MBP1943615.1 GntR family negative regulator for fad regulon and positive regulator of fabA [Cytobacillus luteolus]
MKERSSEIIGRKIIQSILEGDFSINEHLQPERDLATLFSVGRPTIREALQRLERDGWITIRKGMPAIVNDYWKQGNLMTIVDILQYHEEIPDELIKYMLELRISLSPTYVKDAIVHNRVKVIALFVPLDELSDDAGSYADFDWNLQLGIAKLSPNPIFLLILNSFKDIYQKMAEKYFGSQNHRKQSYQYYTELLNAILKGEVEETEALTRKMMETSLILWSEKVKGGD